MVGFGFNSDCSKKWPRFLNQSQSVAMQNQSNHKITFDTSLNHTVILKRTLNIAFKTTALPQSFLQCTPKKHHLKQCIIYMYIP